jgi:hypothetical protein
VCLDQDLVDMFRDPILVSGPTMNDWLPYINRREENSVSTILYMYKDETTHPRNFRHSPFACFAVDLQNVNSPAFVPELLYGLFKRKQQIWLVRVIVAL